MAPTVRNRPFSLLGYRFARGLYDERPAEREGQLYLVVMPLQPIVTELSEKSRGVIELSMILAIAHSDKDDPEELKVEDAAFGPDSVLAVKCEAGYMAKSKKHDGDLGAFDEMLQHAFEQLYQVTRTKAISIAADSGFDASHIPVEVDAKNLFNRQPAASKSIAPPAPVKPSKRRVRKLD